MATLLEISAEMAKLLQPVNDKLTKVDDKVDKLQTSLEMIKEDVKFNDRRYEILEETIREQNIKIEILERKILEKNLIIFGEKEENNEMLIQKVLKIFQTLLNIEDISEKEIEDIRRIGSAKEDNKRPIKVELTSKRRKLEIIKNKMKLRGTQIRIEEEYPKNIVQCRKKLKPFLNEAKNNGYKAHLKYNTLVVNGESFTIKDLEKNTEQERNSTVEENENIRRNSLSSNNTNEIMEERESSQRKDARHPNAGEISVTRKTFDDKTSPEFNRKNNEKRKASSPAESSTSRNNINEEKTQEKVTKYFRKKSKNVELQGKMKQYI